NMALNGYVNVDRGNLRTVAKTMDVCRGGLAKGGPLFMFPEGHRSPDGEIQDFHGGAFKLPVQAGGPGLPIVLDGQHGLFPGVAVRQPTGIAIKVLEPIPLAEAGGTAGKLRDLAQERMRQTLEEMRKNAAAPQTLLA